METTQPATAMPFLWTHFPQPPLTQTCAAAPGPASLRSPALLPLSSHPYLPGVGGARYSLMTEWDDLVLAVRCAWEVPAEMRDAAAAAASGPGQALLRYLRAAPRWLLGRDGSIPPPLAAACPDDFYRALRWAFDRVRAAVLVSIRRGRIALFLPFANDGGWRLPDGVQVQLPRGLASVAEYSAEKHRVQKAKRREDMIPDPRRWWLNGHVVCNVRPADVWGDFQLADLHEILEAALALFPAGHPPPDVDLLLNKRDCPLLVNPHLHARQPRLPVLSPYTSAAALDLPFPLADDWRLAKERAEGPTSAARPGPSPFDRWEQRAPRAVFRGSSTGKGLCERTNLRLALAFFAARPEASPWLDVRITRVNERCQVTAAQGNGPPAEPGMAHPPSAPARVLHVDYPRAADLRAALRDAGAWGPFEALPSQARRFRMAIYVRGHQAASRLGALFRAGFCVVMLRPPGEEFDAPGCLPWFHDKLEPYEGWRQAGPTAERSEAGCEAGNEAGAAPEPTEAVALPEPATKRSKVAASAASRSAEASSTPPPPLPTEVVCVARSLDELLDCVKFLAAHDPIARALAENGHRIVGGMLTREAIARRAADVLLQAASEGRPPAVSPSTHPLFGMTNPAMTATRSARFDLLGHAQ
jgi:hypothetical protein